MKLFSSVRLFFFARYVRFVEFVTLYMLARTGKLVRKLLVLKGKDPDYVAPSPPPPPPPVVPTYYPGMDSEKTMEALNKFYNSKRPSWNTSSQDAWVRNPSLHPVLSARREFESKSQPSVTDPLPEPQPAPLTPDEASELLATEGSKEEWLQVVKTAASEEVDK